LVAGAGLGRGFPVGWRCAALSVGSGPKTRRPREVSNRMGKGAARGIRGTKKKFRPPGTGPPDRRYRGGGRWVIFWDGPWDRGKGGAGGGGPPGNGLQGTNKQKGSGLKSDRGLLGGGRGFFTLSDGKIKPPQPGGLTQGKGRGGTGIGGGEFGGTNVFFWLRKLHHSGEGRVPRPGPLHGARRGPVTFPLSTRVKGGGGGEGGGGKGGDAGPNPPLEQQNVIGGGRPRGRGKPGYFFRCHRGKGGKRACGRGPFLPAGFGEAGQRGITSDLPAKGALVPRRP